MYSPKIYPEQVRELYLLKISYASVGIKKPMTEIVREALDKHISEEGKLILKAGGTLLKPDEIVKNDQQGD